MTYIDLFVAFNRQNHHILFTKLADLGLPGWLLRIVVGFLTHREMVVRYKGEISGVKSLPGGGPQGTLLGLLLFLILINDLGFEGQVNNAGEIITCRKSLKAVNEIHLKYVDDLTYAESIDLKDKLVSVPNNQRPLPDSYHARTGHVLTSYTSKLSQQLVKTEEYAKKNEIGTCCWYPPYHTGITLPTNLSTQYVASVCAGKWVQYSRWLWFMSPPGSHDSLHPG